MKVLVTGGAGYKGVVLCAELLKKGHTVTLLDNFMYGYEPVLHLVTDPNLQVVQLDIRNLSEKSVSGYDVVFHLAGLSGMPACASNPHAAEMVNVESTRKLTSLLHKGQLLVFASTTTLYGAGGEGCDETTSVLLPSLYAKTKYGAETLVLERENSVAFRFATVFGVSPKMRTDLLVNDFVYKALVDRSIVIFAGASKRACIHIQDAVAAYLFALDHIDSVVGGIFNVGDESLNLSKTEIALAICNQVQFEIVDSSLSDLDVRDFSVSFKKIRSLGYKVKFSLDEGISELLKLYSFYRNYLPFRVI